MDTTIIGNPYPESVARGYPFGKTMRTMKITRVSRPDAWYKDMIGRMVDIHYFATFGAWDTQGRWVDYYDVSFIRLEGTTWWEILGVPQTAKITEIKRAYYLKSQIFHPDKSTGNAADFLKLKNAYEQAQKAIA